MINSIHLIITKIWISFDKKFTPISIYITPEPCLCVKKLNGKADPKFLI